MRRYIDADALLEDWGIDIEPIKRRPITINEFRDFMRRYENHPYYFAILAIALATTADVVEVVRCKDCKHYETPNCQEWNDDEDFCSHAERRKDD